MKFETKVIHAGQEPDPRTGAVMTPIYATSTYAQSSPGEHKGFDYARTRNPTRDALQACLAELESGHAAFAFASGMAAMATVVELLDAGSHVIAMHDLYGGSYRLFETVRKRSANLEASFTDLSNPENLEKTLRPNTRMVWVESPTNPLLQIVDLRAVADFARKHGLISVCDNTFASPWIQRPLEQGFDIVVHSTTKYINGHSDVIGGAAVIREDDALKEKLAFLQNAVGGVPSPFDAFLILRVRCRRGASRWCTIGSRPTGAVSASSRVCLASSPMLTFSRCSIFSHRRSMMHISAAKHSRSAR